MSHMEDVHYDNITLSETVRQAVTRRSSLTIQSQRSLTQYDSEAAEELDLCMNYLIGHGPLRRTIYPPRIRRILVET